MFILRMLTDDGIQTLVFDQPIIPGTTAKMARDANIEASNKAAQYVMKTSAAGFIAEVESPDDMQGKIVKKWDHKTHLYGDKYARHSSYSIRYGKYRDTVDGYLGTEEWCRNKCDEVNKDCEGWYSKHAHLEHIVGPLWQCVVTSPYLD